MDIQDKIVELRKEGYSYAGIQLKLGNPSKKFIKETLRKLAPNLLGDVVENFKKLTPKY